MRGITLATQTIKRIDNSIRADQGNEYRRILGTIIHTASDAYAVEDHPFRSHLGASIIGRECSREIWYSFRWAVRPNFIGRMLRLFNRGHLEEARFVAMLMASGHKVKQYDENGKQFRISFAHGQGGGSTDGLVQGVIELPPDTEALGEFKTHNDKSFTKLEKEGVRDSKFEHYVQTNIYMKKKGLPSALYLAVNKDTDELYGEILTLDTEIAEKFMDRGEQIINAYEPPAKINESNGFWKCTYCDKKEVCKNNAIPEKNCRTCRQSQPLADDTGLWFCHLHKCTLDKNQQLIGCTGHERLF